MPASRSSEGNAEARQGWPFFVGAALIAAVFIGAVFFGTGAMQVSAM